MKLLALDCSTEACSVALLHTNGSAEPTIVQRHEQAARQHTQRLLPMVDQLLADTSCSLSQLDAIAFGRGPGSFTGLRICLGAVQGLAFGAELPVIPVSSLAAQAQAVLNSDDSTDKQEIIVSTLDARMDEIYWAVYRAKGGLVTAVGKEHLSAPEQLLSGYDSEHIMAVGSGYHYIDRITIASQFSSWQADIFPSATAVAQLAQAELLAGNSCSADQALPTYLRDEVAWQKQPPLV